MKWISVKDKLPDLDSELFGEFSGDVLLWNGKDYAVGYYCDLLYWMSYDEEFKASEVTHWMPLPPPPTQEQQ